MLSTGAVVGVRGRMWGCRTKAAITWPSICSDSRLEADALLGPTAVELHERGRAAIGWPAKFAAIDEVLLRRLDPRQDLVAAEVRRAWRALLDSGGRLRADERAAGVG